LLLYWALLHNEPGQEIPSDDGFREPEEPGQDYVTWCVENTNTQNVFYLHGALHLFDAGDELKKYTWSRTNIPLMTQIRGAIDGGMFPVFVAEGSSKDKLERLNHSGYLNRGIRSFANIGGALFVYGFAFKENDDHIIKLIAKSKLNKLFVGLYGNVDSTDNKQLIAVVNSLAGTAKSLETYYYDAESAKVWG